MHVPWKQVLFGPPVIALQCVLIKDFLIRMKMHWVPVRSRFSMKNIQTVLKPELIWFLQACQNVNFLALLPLQREVMHLRFSKEDNFPNHQAPLPISSVLKEKRLLHCRKFLPFTIRSYWLGRQNIFDRLPPLQGYPFTLKKNNRMSSFQTIWATDWYNMLKGTSCHHTLRSVNISMMSDHMVHRMQESSMDLSCARAYAGDCQLRHTGCLTFRLVTESVVTSLWFSILNLQF